MREREALRLARAFVARRYPHHAHHYIEVALEQDGERRRSWSFGVHVDEEDPDYKRGENYEWVGYVHADGKVEGLY